MRRCVALLCRWVKWLPACFLDTCTMSAQPSDGEPVLCKAAGRLQCSSRQILLQFISISHRKWGVDDKTVHKLWWSFCGSGSQWCFMDMSAQSCMCSDRMHPLIMCHNLYSLYCHSVWVIPLFTSSVLCFLFYSVVLSLYVSSYVLSVPALIGLICVCWFVCLFWTLACFRLVSYLQFNQSLHRACSACRVCTWVQTFYVSVMMLTLWGKLYVCAVALVRPKYVVCFHECSFTCNKGTVRETVWQLWRSPAQKAHRQQPLIELIH